MGMKKRIRRITACTAALVCAASAVLSGASPGRTLVQAAQTEWHFDFGGGGTANGYTAADAGTGYSKSTGYGFSNTSQVKNVAASGQNALADAVQFTSTSGDNTFNVDLPNGLYEIKVTLGNTTRTSVRAEDVLQIINMTGNNAVDSFTMCHEEKDAGYGISLRDGKTGKMLFREKGDGDTGRCMADNLIAGNNSAEIVGSHNAVVYDTSGNKVCNWSDITKWGQNFAIYWTDTLERCVLDRGCIDQYGKGRVMTADGGASINGTKSTPSLSCDLFGDWREEVIYPANDGKVLRVYTTTYQTESRSTA